MQKTIVSLFLRLSNLINNFFTRKGKIQLVGANSFERWIKVKNTKFKRLTAFVLAVTLCLTTAPAAFADALMSEKSTTVAGTNEDNVISADDIDASNRENTYSAFLERNEGVARPADEIVIYGKDYLKDAETNGAQLSVETVDGVNDVLKWSNQSGQVTFEVDVKTAGLYCIEANYEALEGTANFIEFAVAVNGKIPYTTATRVTLPKVWVNKTEIQKDVHDNDIRPGQVELVKWQTVSFKDIDGLSNSPLAFYFEAGKNTITISSDKATFALNYLKLYNEKELPSYTKPSDAELSQIGDQRYVLEGEEATYKNDRTLYPTSDRTSYLTSPADPTKQRYNTIGKDSWTQATQAITWEFTVEQAGYYKIGIRARQDSMRGLYSNRRLYIDGVVPNKESNQIKFYYGTEWDVVYPEDNNGDPIYYYLEAGTHQITLEAIPGEIGEILDELEDIVYQINTYYRRIREITGPSPDEYTDYKIDKSIPEIVPDFEYYSQRLREIQKKIEKLSGTAGSEAVTLDKMAIVLDKCVERAYRIPSMLSQIKDNISSVSAWMQTYRGQALELDFIEVTSADVDFKSTKKSFFSSLSFGFKSFIGSFFEDYNSLSEEGEESLTVWVSLGRDQAQVVKQLVDNSFNQQSDVKVAINLVQGGIIEATLAGKGPDIALFIGGDFPIQLAARGVLTDLTQFPDYDEAVKNFTETAPVLYTYNDGVYGLPVSQTFPMLFYRRDILESYGIDAEEDLNTWEDFIEVLPVLQRNYMAAGLVLAAASSTVPTTTEAGNTFATLLLQKGVNFYNEDKTATTFDSQEAIDAFEMWTKFYTTYSFEQTYDPFTRFRTGDMPIVINGYTFFNQLTVAAPEIKGCWEFRTIPGTVQPDGTINHASCSGGSGAIIFEACENQQAAWDFIKWFTSTETQVAYANDIEALMGTMGRFDTANVEALKQLSWTASELEMILDQMEAQVEIPIIPASYAVTRNLTNAFRTVVNEAENPRDTLMWYNKDINAEIIRKLEDLGMYNN